MATNPVPIAIHHSGHGHPSDAGSGLVLLVVGALVALIWGGMEAWLGWTISLAPGSDVHYRRARRLRAARRVGAREAKEGEDVLIRARVVAPLGGLVRGFGDTDAAWTRLQVGGGGQADRIEEHGEIVLEDVTGDLVSVESRSLEITGHPPPGIAPDVRWAWGQASELPPRIVVVLRELGYAFADAQAELFRFHVATEQLVPGEDVFLVGPIRRLEDDPAKRGAGGYREHRGAAQIASDDGDRFLVRADSEEDAEAQLAEQAAHYLASRRRTVAWAAVTVASLVVVVYGFTHF